MTTYTWTTGVSGDWATATDWTPAGGPPDTTAAVARIDATGTFTVSIADGESDRRRYAEPERHQSRP
jgi:hypothetical protein